MRTSRRKNAKGKVVIRSAARAVFALGLLLAPVPARCSDGPAKLTVEDCREPFERPNPPPVGRRSLGAGHLLAREARQHFQLPGYYPHKR